MSGAEDTVMCLRIDDDDGVGVEREERNVELKHILYFKNFKIRTFNIVMKSAHQFSERA